jgi:hypothetical protein
VLSAWKCAIVTPIHKGSTASRPANYRPTSLTSVFCKLIERVVSKQLISYLRQHDLILRHQHGFISKRSTPTNLLECVSDWSLAIKNRQSITAAYIDYSKAFDTVSCNKLLIKLIHMASKDASCNGYKSS